MTSEMTKVDDSMFGGNASAEGGDDETADGAVSRTGCNIVIVNFLTKTGFDKKGYQVYMKDYMKA